MNNSLISLINKEKRKTFVFTYFLSKHQAHNYKMDRKQE